MQIEENSFSNFELYYTLYIIMRSDCFSYRGKASVIFPFSKYLKKGDFALALVFSPFRVIDDLVLQSEDQKP